jgi:hypothetical protein
MSVLARKKRRKRRGGRAPDVRAWHAEKRSIFAGEYFPHFPDSIAAGTSSHYETLRKQVQTPHAKAQRQRRKKSRRHDADGFP